MKRITHPLLSILLAVVCLALAIHEARAASPSLQTPNLQETHRAALHFHGLRGDLDRWSRRARLANVAPTIQLQAGFQDTRDQGTSYREDQLFEAAGLSARDSVRNQVERDRSRRQTYAIKVGLEPGALIFDPRELQASRHAHQLALHRARLLERVSKAYLDRERAMLELHHTPKDNARAIALATHDIARQDALLDAMTGGWWSANLATLPPKDEAPK